MLYFIEMFSVNVSVSSFLNTSFVLYYRECNPLV